MSDPKELFSAGRLLARQKAKYMRAMLLKFAPISVEGLGTIGVTEHGVMLIDWEFIAAVGAAASSSEQAARQVGGLLIHETLHVLLKHGARARVARRDRKLGNMADDLAINDMVHDLGLALPGGGPGVTPEHPHHGLYPVEFGWERGLTSDEYYGRLMKKQPPPQAQQCVGKGSGGQQGQGNSGAGGEGEPEEQNDESGEGGQGGDADHQQPGRAPKKPKTGGGWCGSCAGNPLPNEPGGEHKASRSEAEMARAAREVAQAIREEGSHGRGTVPAFLARWADELLAPPEIPWEHELARITRNAIAWRPNAVDHKYDAPSRRQAGIGFGPGKPVLPRYRMPVPNVTMIFDTSGSMGTHELGVAGREASGILKAVGANVTMVTCDAAVTGVTKVKNLKEVLSRLKGGGGTDMRPAIDECLKQRPRPDVIVCLTDLCIGDPGPEPPGLKMVWVGVGPYAEQSAAPKWGRTIIVKDKKTKGEAA